MNCILLLDPKDQFILHRFEVIEIILPKSLLVCVAFLKYNGDVELVAPYTEVVTDMFVFHKF